MVDTESKIHLAIFFARKPLKITKSLQMIISEASVNAQNLFEVNIQKHLQTIPKIDQNILENLADFLYKNYSKISQPTKNILKSIELDPIIKFLLEKHFQTIHWDSARKFIEVLIKDYPNVASETFFKTFKATIFQNLQFKEKNNALKLFLRLLNPNNSHFNNFCELSLGQLLQENKSNVKNLEEICRTLQTSNMDFSDSLSQQIQLVLQENLKSSNTF